MQFTIGRDALFAELNMLRKYLSKTHQALSNFLFLADTTNQTVLVFASNTESNIMVTLPAQVVDAGERILNSEILLNALKKLPPGSQITLDDATINSANQTLLTCGRTKLKINHLDGHLFPVWKNVTPEHSVTMKSEDFRFLIQSLAFARLPENKALQQSDHKFEGINMKVTQGDALFICTDKSRFAFGRYKFASSFDVEITMSGQALLDFASGLPSGEIVNINIDITNERISLECKGKQLIPARYLDKYPEILRLIPAPISTIEVKREELVQKLEVAQLVGVIVDIKAENNTLHLENQGSGTGHFIDDIPASVSSSMEISLNVPFLLDGLKAMTEDDVEILLAASDKPAIIRPKGKNEYSYLLLPIV